MTLDRRSGLLACSLLLVLGPARLAAQDLDCRIDFALVHQQTAFTFEASGPAGGFCLVLLASAAAPSLPIPGVGEFRLELASTFPMPPIALDGSGRGSLTVPVPWSDVQDMAAAMQGLVMASASTPILTPLVVVGHKVLTLALAGQQEWPARIKFQARGPTGQPVISYNCPVSPLDTVRVVRIRANQTMVLHTYTVPAGTPRRSYLFHSVPNPQVMQGDEVRLEVNEREVKKIGI